MRKGTALLCKRRCSYIPTFTFSRRLGHTTYSVNVFSKDNEAATYEDKLLELIRSGALQADASEKPKGSPAEHAA